MQSPTIRGLRSSPSTHLAKRVEYENLIGPISLSEHTSQEQGKQIYIFGDHHVNDVLCPDPSRISIPIQLFMRETIRNNPDKIIDVFLEVDYINKDIARGYDPAAQGFEGASWINKVTASFSTCLEIDKTLCDIPNTRVHYADLRGTDTFIFPLYSGLMMYKELLRSKESGYTPSSVLLYVYKGRQLLSDFTEAELVELLIEDLKVTKYRSPFDIGYILGLPKVRKQLNNIENVETAKFLVEYFETKIVPVTREDIDKMLTAVSKLEKLPYSVEKLLFFSINIMDLYLVSRLLRTYSDGTKANYAMIYAGDLHSENYRQILSLLGYNELINVRSDNYDTGTQQCLDIRNFEQPFFSAKAPPPEPLSEVDLLAAGWEKKGSGEWGPK